MFMANSFPLRLGPVNSGAFYLTCVILDTGSFFPPNGATEIILRTIICMKYQEALKIAEETLEQLRPHCHRCEIAGSIRRKKDEVKDIEIVAIPKPYDIGLLESGITTVVNKWKMVKGKLPCKYTQRILPQGIKLDLFFADEINWGYIYAIRTGSAEYSHNVLAKAWCRKGLKGDDGYLTRNGYVIPVPEEQDLFNLIGVEYVAPENRTFVSAMYDGL